MIIPIALDPAMHEIIPTDAGKHLSRELGLDNLITYRHRLWGTWLVALTRSESNGRTMLAEIGMLGTGDGEGPWISRTNCQNIKRKMRDVISPQEARRRLRSGMQRRVDEIDEIESDACDGVHTLHQFIKRTQGDVKAEQYARSVGGMLKKG